MVLAVASEPTFQRERLADLLDEIAPLLVAHWIEVAPYQDIPIKPNTKLYLHLEEIGVLRCFTLRQEGKLIGYAIFCVMDSPQSEGFIQAEEVVFYLAPEHRVGMNSQKMIHVCKAELRKEGVRDWRQKVRPKCNFSPVLERAGFELTGYDYSCRLDKE